MANISVSQAASQQQPSGVREMTMMSEVASQEAQAAHYSHASTPDFPAKQQGDCVEQLRPQLPEPHMAQQSQKVPGRHAYPQDLLLPSAWRPPYASPPHASRGPPAPGASLPACGASPPGALTNENAPLQGGDSSKVHKQHMYWENPAAAHSLQASTRSQGSADRLAVGENITADGSSDRGHDQPYMAGQKHKQASSDAASGEGLGPSQPLTDGEGSDSRPSVQSGSRRLQRLLGADAYEKVSKLILLQQQQFSSQVRFSERDLI